MCDLDEPKIWEEHTVAARKEHQCEDCDSPIVKGEKHIRIGALYDGWTTFRVHVECMAWRRAHQAWMREYWQEDCGAEMGGLIEALEEAQRELRPTLRLVVDPDPNFQAVRYVVPADIDREFKVVVVRGTNV